MTYWGKRLANVVRIGRRHLNVQGLLAPNILVTKAQRREPGALPDAVIEFCNWCLFDAGLIRQEVQPDAWLIYYTSEYLGQVANGGHGQFAGNTGMDLFRLQTIETGLDVLNLHSLLSIFRQFTAVMDADQALKSRVMAGCGFGDIPKIIKILDKAFYLSPDPSLFGLRASAWLRRNQNLLALTPAEKRTREKAIVASNTLLPDRRRAASSRPMVDLTLEAAWRLWDRTGLRRPGESRYEHIRRTFAAGQDGHDLEAEQTRLQVRFDMALAESDGGKIDSVIAAYRELHRRYQLHNQTGWSSDLRRLGAKLLMAGERLGRPDLLEQAADALGQSIAAGGGDGSGFDLAYAWCGLGQALVALARIDDRNIPALTEAADAFNRAIAIDEARSGNRKSHTTNDSQIGQAEAFILLASRDNYERRLRLAKELLKEAHGPDTLPGSQRKAAAYAEALIMSPQGDITEKEKRRARRLLDAAIVREMESDGAVWASPLRLQRLQNLRADVRLASTVT